MATMMVYTLKEEENIRQLIAGNILSQIFEKMIGGGMEKISSQKKFNHPAHIIKRIIPTQFSQKGIEISSS